MVCIDQEGEVTWDIVLDNGSSKYFHAMRETENGIVLAGYNHAH